MGFTACSASAHAAVRLAAFLFVVNTGVLLAGTSCGLERLLSWVKRLCLRPGLQSKSLMHLQCFAVTVCLNALLPFLC
jgi:hypothetical protein